MHNQWTIAMAQKTIVLAMSNVSDGTPIRELYYENGRKTRKAIVIILRLLVQSRQGVVITVK